MSSPAAPVFPPVLQKVDRALLTTFVVCMVSSLAGLASITNFAQPLEVIVIPTIANMFAAATVFRAPVLALATLPALAMFSLAFIDDPTAAVFLVSAAGVGTFRVSGLLHHRATLGSCGLGLRCAYLVFIPNFMSAAPIAGSLASAYLSACAVIVSSLASAYFAYRLVLAVVPLELLQGSVIISSAALAVIANFALGSLDGMYHLAFAYPAGICFTQPIQNKVHCSQSLQEFWGRRWNVSISRALKYGVFDPLRSRFSLSSSAAAAAVFFASGVLHVAQFAAWRRPAGELASVMMFFVAQIPLILVEKKLFANNRPTWFGSAALREAWTWCALLASGPLLLVPVERVYNPWGTA